MPILPSICGANYTDSGLDELLKPWDGDVALDDFAAAPAPEKAEIYSHGYTVRVDLKTKEPGKAMAHLGWTESSVDWRHAELKFGSRWVLRGSSVLTQRGPRNKKLPMARRNRAWRTKLYTVEYDAAESGHFLILRGVRRSDVERLLQRHMKLEPQQYCIAYFLDLERYFVLSPHEAMRLAVALGGVPHSGRGRLTRKQFLARDLEFPVTVRTRSKQKAFLQIYRIRRGATAAYKVELRLKGRRQARSHFFESDTSKLDEVLQDLIDEHSLTPIPKPARWEPCGAPQWRRDPVLARMRSLAYRGYKPQRGRIRATWKCHTLNVRVYSETSACSPTCRSKPCIREELGSEVERAARSAPSAWGKLVDDIMRFEGMVAEVILDTDQTPEPLLRALAGRVEPGALGVQIIADDLNGRPDCFLSAVKYLSAFPPTEEMRTLVVVIDWSIVMAVDEGLVSGESFHDLRFGPLWPIDRRTFLGEIPVFPRTLEALLSPTLEELRELCEATGLRAVIVTVDAREEKICKSRFPTRCYGDFEIRSHIGDAGRYFSHLRYLVTSAPGQEPTRVVMVKDEGEGQPGRLLWGRVA